MVRKLAADGSLHGAVACEGCSLETDLVLVCWSLAIRFCSEICNGIVSNLGMGLFILTPLVFRILQ